MESTTRRGSDLAALSRAMVALHKEQFGKGPTSSHSHFAGRNTLVCVLEGALLAAEKKMVELGDSARVRETRVAFQAATEAEFVNAVEQIFYRKVCAFSSAVDPRADVVYEVFSLEPAENEEDIDDLADE